MPPRQSPSFENQTSQPTSPENNKDLRWTDAMQSRFDEALKKQSVPLHETSESVSLPVSEIVTVPSKYGNNVVSVIKTVGVNDAHEPESIAKEEGGEAIFQPLEPLSKTETKENIRKRPSISMTNRLVGVGTFLKKIGAGVRDTLFPGLDSDVEVEHSILRGKNGMPELEYNRIHSILTSPESKISNERRAGFLAQIEESRRKQIAKEKGYINQNENQTEPTFEESSLPIHASVNEVPPHTEPHLEMMPVELVNPQDDETREHIDIFSASPSSEPSAQIIPVDPPILTEIVPDVKKSDETSQEVPFIDPLHVAYMKAQKEHEAQQAPSTEKAPATLKGRFTNTANRLKKFFSLKKKDHNEFSDEEIDDHYMDHETVFSEINTLYTSAISHMEEKTTATPFVDPLYVAHMEAHAKNTEGTPSVKTTSPEQLKNWEKKFENLRNIQKKTNNLFKETLEKASPASKKLVTLLTAGSEYINTQVNNKAVRTFAAAGLITAGALAAYATPVVLASMAGVGFGLRIVSAAKLYTSAREVLDTKYEKWAREGKKVHGLKVAGLEIGAAGAAIFAGDVVGKIFEGIASLDIVREVATSIKNTANIDSVTEAWSKLFNGDTPVSVPAVDHPVTATPSVAPTSTLDTAASSAQQAATKALESVASDPSLIHTVAKGDSLWSLLRADLERLDFEGFKGLNQGDQEKMIQKFVDKIDVPSGSKDLIRIKETLDFNKYFKS
jgi:hypothetical protein